MGRKWKEGMASRVPTVQGPGYYLFLVGGLCSTVVTLFLLGSGGGVAGCLVLVGDPPSENDPVDQVPNCCP